MSAEGLELSQLLPLMQALDKLKSPGLIPTDVFVKAVATSNSKLPIGVLKRLVTAILTSNASVSKARLDSLIAACKLEWLRNPVPKTESHSERRLSNSNADNLSPNSHEQKPDLQRLVNDLHTRILQQHRHLVEAFVQYDVDNVGPIQDGHLSLNEFLNALQKLKLPCSQQDQVQMFQLLDLDKDNLLNYDEFCGAKTDIGSGRVSRYVKAKHHEDISVPALNDSLYRHPLYYLPRKRRLRSLEEPFPSLTTSIMGPVAASSKERHSKLNQSLELLSRPRPVHRRGLSFVGK